MKNMNKVIFMKCILFAIISAILSTPLQLFNSIVIEGQTGKPEFVTITFLLYAVSMKVFFALGYILFGYKLPVKNTRLRAQIYYLLIWGSSYMPNILAMVGGDGEIIKASFSASIVIFDSISYMIDGFVLGLLMKSYHKDFVASVFSKSKLLLSCIVNGVIFVMLTYVFDLIAGSIDETWYLYMILGVSETHKVKFYLTFLLFMFIAGMLQPIWYRYTKHPDTSHKGTVIWTLQFGVLIWNPVVLIMIFFGTAVVETICYAIIFLITILLCTLIYSNLFFRKATNAN